MPGRASWPRGTVRLEPSGWGTKVILTARAAGASTSEPPAGERPEAGSPAESLAPAADTPQPVVREPEQVSEPMPVPAPGPVPEPAPVSEPAPVIRREAGRLMFARSHPPVGEDRRAPVGEDRRAPVGEDRRAPVGEHRRGRFFTRVMDWLRPPDDDEGVASEIPAVDASAGPEIETPSDPLESTSLRRRRRPLYRFGPDASVTAAPQPVDAAPQPPASLQPHTSEHDGLDAVAVLTAALDSLGQAHHRPFSRA